MKIIVPHKLTLTQCSIAESDEDDGAVWEEGKSYAKGDKVRYEHAIYLSLAASNKGNKPSETWSGENAKWGKYGATGPYKMLDDYVETQTEAPKGEKLTFTVPFNRATAFALLNMEGASAHVTVTDTDDDEVLFDEEFSLIEDISHLSLFEYYFEPLVCVDVFTRTSLPFAINGTLMVELDPGDETLQAKIGHVVVGRDRYIGMTKYEAEVGTTDYSRKVVDEFGSTTLVRRSFAKTASLPIYLHPDQSNGVTRILQDIRATPCVFLGDNMDEGYRALMIFGWLEDWRHVFSAPNEVELSMEIQGLI